MTDTSTIPDVLHGHHRGRSRSRRRSHSVNSYNMPLLRGWNGNCSVRNPHPNPWDVVPRTTRSLWSARELWIIRTNLGSYPGQPGSNPGQYAGSQYGGGVPMSMHGGGTAYAGSDPGGPIGSGGYVKQHSYLWLCTPRPRSVSMSMPGHYPPHPILRGYDDGRASSRPRLCPRVCRKVR